jgi:heat shock protein HslJ
MRFVAVLGLVLALAACTAVPAPSPSPTAIVDADLSGNWQLVSGADARGIFPTSTIPVTLIFADGTLGGHGPCNWYGAEPSGFPYFPVEGIASDGMECPESFEPRYFDALKVVEPSIVTEETLLLAGDDVELRFEPIPAQPIDEFVDIEWLLESFTTGDIVSVATGESTLFLATDGELRGNTGCRDFTGTWVEYLGQLGASDFDTPDGNCTSTGSLAVQDEVELTMLTGGFRASVSRDQLTLTATTSDDQLIYRAS